MTFRIVGGTDWKAYGERRERPVRWAGDAGGRNYRLSSSFSASTFLIWASLRMTSR